MDIVGDPADVRHEQGQSRGRLDQRIPVEDGVVAVRAELVVSE